MDHIAIPRLPMKRLRVSARELDAEELAIDTQTFRDLEIFTAQEGQPSLFGLFDRARTAGGAAVLRRRFERPFSSVDRIRAVQDSIRHILLHRTIFNLLPGEITVSTLESYFLSSTTLLGSTSRVGEAYETMELRIGDARRFRQLTEGVRRMLRMMHVLRELAARPELAEAPGELGELLAEIRRVLASPALAALPVGPDARLRPLRTMQVDRVLRQEERAAVERLLRLIFEIDALISMTDATAVFELTLPEALEGPTAIRAEGVYHPFLPDPVSNPLDLDQSRRFLFLTGPNMAGKTTYLRACGIATYLAHLGMGVPARSFTFSPAQCLFTAIALTDDVRAGISFFRAEALRVRRIAELVADGQRVVALLDEPFKGTNVKDALDASDAIFRRLARMQGSLFMVASHLIEVGAALEATGDVDCRRFDADESGEQLAFDFILRPGISAQRLGLRVLQEEGVFDLLETGAARQLHSRRRI